MSFKACRAFSEQNQVITKIVDMKRSSPGVDEVLIQVEYSSINYKDALAASGRGKILKQFPLNVGIDLAGVVAESNHKDFKVGQPVLVNGCGLGEQFDGGLAQFAKVHGQWVMPMPEGLTSRTAMILGTAGFTAALCIHRMQQNGQKPELGPIVVTGATGGVGNAATILLSGLGYEVIAITTRKEQFEHDLKALGASQVLTPDGLRLGKGPLEKARFGGAIDNVGGDLLSRIYAHTQLWGNIACVGMAASPTFSATVFPLILRGVSMLGVSSTNCPMPLRTQIWQELGRSIDNEKLEKIVFETLPLTEILPCFEALLDRKIHGRYLVDCR